MKLIEFKQQKEIPGYLTHKSGLASSVVFATIFALLFINIYKPFSSTQWGGGDVTTLEYLLWSMAIVFVGFVVLVISRIILYFYAKRHRMFYWVFAVWIIVEISAMSIIYTSIATLAMPATAGLKDGTQVVDFFWSCFSAIFFVLLIPTMLSWLYLAFWEKKNALQKLENQYKGSDIAAPVIDQPTVVQFKDEKGEIRLSVKLENVIWIESDDNYVHIKYQNQGKMLDYLLRNSLKRLVEDLKDTTIFRCHRKYMVNFDHAVALRKGGVGLVLELDTQPMVEIPVTDTYKEDISLAFMKYSNRK